MRVALRSSRRVFNVRWGIPVINAASLPVVCSVPLSHQRYFATSRTRRRGGAEQSSRNTDENTLLSSLCHGNFAPLAALFGPISVSSLSVYTEEKFIADAKAEGVAAGVARLFLAQTLSDGRTLESFLCPSPTAAHSPKRVLPDVSTAPAILSWIKSLLPVDALRKNAFDPGPMFQEDDFGPGVWWNREEVEREAVAYFQNALYDGPAGSTQRNGMCATLAARGCGKSLAVDRLCRLHDKKGSGGKFILGEELNARLVPVCISFNGPQSLEDDDGDGMSSAKALFLCRVAHRAFSTGEARTYSDFAEKTKGEWDRVNPSRLFEAMVLHFQQLGVAQPVILLAVDEVIKCGGERAIAVIKLAKSWLDNFTSQFRLLSTTFDNHLLVDGAVPSPALHLRDVTERTQTPGSKRTIRWLPLKPLAPAEPTEHLLKLKPSWMDNRQLDYLVSLTGGHPRSLALLKLHLQCGENKKLTRLQNDWARELLGYLGRVDNTLVEEMLARSLLGVPVDIEEQIAGMSVRQMVQETVMVNALDPVQSPCFVPQLSLLRLYVWSQVQSPSNVQARVADLLELGSRLEHRSFEEFTAIFEDLRCWAWHRLGRGLEATFSKWFPHAAVIHGSEDLVVDIPKPTLKRIPTLERQLSDMQGLIEHYSLATQGQAGFDVVCPMGKSLICLEIRYSEPPHSEHEPHQKLSPAEDVRRKAVLAAQQIARSRAQISGGAVSVASTAFVLAGLREARPDLAAFAASCRREPDERRVQKAHETWNEFKKLEMMVAVMDRNALLAHYGPTFGSLGGFMLDYASR